LSHRPAADPHVTVVIPVETLDVLRKKAEAQRRSLSKQALLYIERGLEADP